MSRIKQWRMTALMTQWMHEQNYMMENNNGNDRMNAWAEWQLIKNFLIHAYLPCLLACMQIALQNHSLQKSDVSDSLLIREKSSQKTSELLEKFVFWYVFDHFPLLWIAPVAHLLFFKEWLERFAPVALYIGATKSYNKQKI